MLKQAGAYQVQPLGGDRTHQALTVHPAPCAETGHIRRALPPVWRQDASGTHCPWSRDYFSDFSAHQWTNGLEVDGSELQSLQCNPRGGGEVITLKSHQPHMHLKELMGREASLLPGEPT